MLEIDYALANTQEAFTSLDASRRELRELLDQTQEQWTLWLANQSRPSRPSRKRVDTVRQEFCGVTKRPPEQSRPTGVLITTCHPLLEAIDALNDAKKLSKEAVATYKQTLREQKRPPQDKTSVDTETEAVVLDEWLEKGHWQPVDRTALTERWTDPSQTLNLATLHRQISRFRAPIERLSYYWNTSALRTKRVTRSAAKVLIGNLKDDGRHNIDQYKDALSGIGNDQSLRIVRPQPPRLMALYRHQKGSPYSGLRSRSFAALGITVLPQESFPRDLEWASNERPAATLEIDEHVYEPVIPQLNLYLYRDQKRRGRKPKVLNHD